MNIRTPSRKVVLISLSLFLFFGIFAFVNFIHELRVLFAFMSGETVPAYSDLCRTPGVNCAELPVLHDYAYDVFGAFVSVVPFIIALVVGLKIARKQVLNRFWMVLWSIAFLFYPLLVIYYLLHGDIRGLDSAFLYACGFALLSVVVGIIGIVYIRKAAVEL